MEDNSKEVVKENEKPSYEDLKNWCNQLYGQNQQMAKALNSFNVLPYLFEVLKAKELFDKEFVDETIDNIKVILGKPKK